MSIQAEQALSNRLGEIYICSETGPRQTKTKVSDRFDFGAVYAIGSSLLIWGCFALILWSLS